MSRPSALRTWSVRLHRWAALVLGLWLVMLGLTGTVLVWNSELDRALNPGWFAARVACGAEHATPVATTLAIHARAGGGPATMVMRPEVPGAAWIVWTKSGDRRLQHFVDPACGLHLGTREWGATRFDREHLVPALYELHRSLLSGEAGHVAVGVGGFWLLGILVTGVVNAWPRNGSRAAWARTLAIKRGSEGPRFFYDLHRAVGMWMTPFLVLMALTGIYLCFPKPTRALVAQLLPMQAEPATGGPVAPAAALGHDILVARAERLWPDAAWSRVHIPASAGEPVDVRLLQADELRKDTGDTRVRFTAGGRVLDRRDPLQAPAGDRLVAWMFPLHSGEALGMAGRLAWTLFGTVPALMFASGLWLWLHRRRARRQMELRRASTPTTARPAPRPVETPVA